MMLASLNRKLPIPSRVKGFIWKVAHNRIQSMDNLVKRKIVPEEANLICLLCNELVETAQHLLFECVFSHHIWTRCYEDHPKGL